MEQQSSIRFDLCSNKTKTMTSHGCSKKEASKSRSRSRRRRSSDSDSESYSYDSDHRSKNKRSITEEEIAKYMVKKAQKKARNVSGYSNDDDSNPFGDANLDERFVWSKKIEQDIVVRGVPVDSFSLKAEKKRQRERMEEIEKVKKRRAERAAERALHEEEMARLARERQRAEFEDLKRKEQEFLYDQSKVRSKIRLSQGRAKPIDILSKNLLIEDSNDDLNVEISEPYMVFKGLTMKDLEELRGDIKLHLDSDNAAHTQYWEALLVVCDWELSEEARRKDRAEEGGFHSSVEAGVKNHLQGKTHSELVAMQSEIESQMRSGVSKVVEFWEAIIKRIHIYKAKAFLKEIHTNMLSKHLQHLQGDQEDVEEAGERDQEEEEEEFGSYSPQVMHCDDDDDESAIDPEEDMVILERKRKAVLESQQRRLQPEDNLELKAIKEMGAPEEGDMVFGSGAEANLHSQVYWWHDKYRPRKPKYLNRVHTGYNWNQYNRTHYDHENPPPKAVLGYKFNIFYPDLVDKTKAPALSIENDGNKDGETCILRFHAGPPYEDVAFRIVNKEWEWSHKKGFKCTFERGILQLYFNFKRHCYRR